MKQRIIKILESKWLQHPVFWVLSLYAVGSYFSISSLIKFIDFIYAAFFHIPLMALVYINLYHLIPNFLQKGKYVPYFLLSFFNLGFAYFLHEITFEFVIPILPTAYYMVSFTDMSVLFTIFGIYWVFTTLFKLSKSWYRLQKQERYKLQFELNSLKMQINPHFLFNSLNSMYSLALSKSDKTPEVILGLSDLMRYMIYEVTDDRVELEKEIEAITHYLDLQKLRVEKVADIQFTIEGDASSASIAPLLFFPLIENSFKHGLSGSKKKGFVRIDLTIKNKQISFNIENDKGLVDEVEKEKYGGIGLENVKKRLELIYGSKSSFSINENAETFSVNITITP